MPIASESPDMTALAKFRAFLALIHQKMAGVTELEVQTASSAKSYTYWYDRPR